MRVAAAVAPRSRMSQQHGRRFPERVETLVVSGGGMKGFASLGAAVALRRCGALRDVRTLVGTSAGALVAAALAVDRASLGVLRDLTRAQYRPDVDLSRLLGSFGLDSGQHLELWIATLLGGVNYTFRDVREIFGVDLVVCVTNLTRRGPEYMGPDSTPSMEVATALRMSCTIPLYFSAVKHGSGVYVDGAVSDNFPIAWAGDRYGHDTVLGIAFKPRTSSPATSLEDYVGALVESSTRRNHAAGADARVLQLDTGARSAFEFGMSHRDMKKLYLAGRRQANEWWKKHS
jgi:predicted acylesterase/phospholipase RssA